MLVFDPQVNAPPHRALYASGARSHELTKEPACSLRATAERWAWALECLPLLSRPAASMSARRCRRKASRRCRDLHTTTRRCCGSTYSTALGSQAFSLVRWPVWFCSSHAHSPSRLELRVQTWAAACCPSWRCHTRQCLWCSPSAQQASLCLRSSLTSTSTSDSVAASGLLSL